jgi:nucleotide-binding universal stress UspA family protein
MMNHFSRSIRGAALFQCRYQSILVGLSATQYGDMALQQAIRMSRDGDTVTGIFVPPVVDGSYIPPNALQVMKEKRTQQLKELMQRANKVAEETKAACSSKVNFQTKELEPSVNRRQAIVNACWSMKADVLVLGSLGAGAARLEQEKIPYDEQKYQQNYHAVASVPDFAMHNAPCPVFVVKPKCA